MSEITKIKVDGTTYDIAGGGAIDKIEVNGKEQEIVDKTVDITVPTKVSELENDSGYITDEALDGYAKEDAVEAVKETADSALEKADSAITAISVNGEDVPVENNKAEITVGGAPTVADETMYFVGDKPIYDEPTETVIF